MCRVSIATTEERCHGYVEFQVSAKLRANALAKGANPTPHCVASRQVRGNFEIFYRSESMRDSAKGPSPAVQSCPVAWHTQRARQTPRAAARSHHHPPRDARH